MIYHNLSIVLTPQLSLLMLECVVNQIKSLRLVYDIRRAKSHSYFFCSPLLDSPFYVYYTYYLTGKFSDTQ